MLHLLLSRIHIILESKLLVLGFQGRQPIHSLSRRNDFDLSSNIIWKRELSDTRHQHKL